MSDALWRITRDGDPVAYALFERHYSYHAYRDARRARPGYRQRWLFVGPGEKLVLLTPDARALLVWRRFRSRDGQAGVNCAIFRNEGAFEGQVRSSKLLLAAEAMAWTRWPDARLYTYVNAQAVRSPNPGYCFKVAGWQVCGVTQVHRLLILEKWPEEKDGENAQTAGAVGASASGMGTGVGGSDAAGAAARRARHGGAHLFGHGKSRALWLRQGRRSCPWTASQQRGIVACR